MQENQSYTDMASLCAKEAESLEKTKHYKEAIEKHCETERLYRQAAGQYKLAAKENENSGRVSDQSSQMFLTALAEEHARKIKFINLRLSDSQSMYDVDAIKQKLDQKMNRVTQLRLYEKG